jgi:hypothetical protein
MKYIGLVLFFGFLTYNTYGQHSKIKEIYKDGEEFFADEDYKEAIFYFLQVTEKGYTNPNLQFKIGVCYLNIPGEEYKAVAFLEEAAKHITSKYKANDLSERQAPLHALFYLGNAYRIDNQLDKALASYDKFINSPNYEGNYNLSIVETEIQACERAKLIQDAPVDVSWEKLSLNVNTPNTDLYPVVSGNEDVLVYQTALKLYNAVYFSRKVDGQWRVPENINPQIMSDGDMYPTALSFDGKELYLIKQTANNKDIYYSKYVDGTWTVAKPLNKNINTSQNEESAAISRDGKTLYFSSNRRESKGGYDLFKSTKGFDGEWGKPENLGKTINTKADEISVSITPDEKTIYFSSKGHYNMGGFDIFYSEMGKDGKWEIPVNAGYPVNTTNDNTGFKIVTNDGVGYISKNSKPGRGSEDMYRLQILSKFESKASSSEKEEK